MTKPITGSEGSLPFSPLAPEKGISSLQGRVAAITNQFQGRIKEEHGRVLNSATWIVFKIIHLVSKVFKIISSCFAGLHKWAEEALEKSYEASSKERILRILSTKIPLSALDLESLDLELVEKVFSQDTISLEKLSVTYKFLQYKKLNFDLKAILSHLKTHNKDAAFNLFINLPSWLKDRLYEAFASAKKISIYQAERLFKQDLRILMENGQKTASLIEEVVRFTHKISEGFRDVALLSKAIEDLDAEKEGVLTKTSFFPLFLSPLAEAEMNIPAYEKLFSLEEKKTHIDRVRHHIYRDIATVFDKNLHLPFDAKSSQHFATDISQISLCHNLDQHPTPLRITMVAAEFAGLHNQGGLAEAVEGLAKGLKSYNAHAEISLIFPKYSSLPSAILERMVKSTQRFVSDKGEEFSVNIADIEGIKVYFVDDPQFQLDETKNIYGPDEETVKARFTRFASRAADMLMHIETDVIHLHDWHAAGVALKLGHVYKKSFDTGEIPPLVFTFHNHSRSAQGRMHTGSQGIYNYPKALSHLTSEELGVNNINLFAEALKLADMVTTVSQTYAQEVQRVGSDGISLLAQRASRIGKLYGIINGVNVQRWNVETNEVLKTWKDIDTGDPCPLNFDLRKSDEELYQQRLLCCDQLGKWIKRYAPTGHLQKTTNTPTAKTFKFDPTKPLVGYIGRYDFYQKGLDSFEEAIQVALREGAQVILMGSQEDEEATKILDMLAQKYPEGVLFIRDYKNAEGKWEFQQGSDGRPGIGPVIRAALTSYLMPSSYEPCGLVQFEAWRFGSEVIGSNTGGIADTIITPEKSTYGFNGYLFEKDAKEGPQSLGAVLTESIRRNAAASFEERGKIMRRIINASSGYGWHSKGSVTVTPVQKYTTIYRCALIKASERTSRLIQAPHEIFQQIINRSPRWRALDITFDFEAEYLAAYHSEDASTERLLPLYKKLPFAIRHMVPDPYGKGVNFARYKTEGLRFDGRVASIKVTAPEARSVVLRLYGNDNSTLDIELTSSKRGWTAENISCNEGQRYHLILNGVIKLDPYALQIERLEESTTPFCQVVKSDSYKWNDSSWLHERNTQFQGNKPLSIYEMHPTTWAKTEGASLNYRELGKRVAAYCKKEGYTHVELMGLLDHPHESSLGYQVTSFFAPNHRLGTREDCKAMIDYLHTEGIGVILDWVGGHFATDDYGLSSFDGSRLYETNHRDIRYLFSARPYFGWGTYFFNYRSPEVREFLISNAMYWIKEMHIDGIRVDAVKSMLYSEDPEAARLFLANLNSIILREGSGAISIAEDYSGDSSLTTGFADDGLGFSLKWDINWMKNTLNFFALPLSQRESSYSWLIRAIEGDLFHPMIRALSHDESAEHSLLNLSSKLSQEEKYANLRALLSFMFCLPGKKLNFMTNVTPVTSKWTDLFGTKSAVSEKAADPRIEALEEMMKDLNHLYKDLPAMSELDTNGRDLEWIEKADSKKQVIAYRRTSKTSTQIACLHNFTDEEAVQIVRLPLLKDSEDTPAYTLTEVFNSDNKAYGGTGKINDLSVPIRKDKKGLYYLVRIPALSTVMISENLE